MLSYSLERQVADALDGGEVDSVLHSFLELGEGMCLIAVVYHQYVMVNEQVQVVLVKSEKQCRPDHISSDPVGVC